ncbi:class I SAM-dependent methyltransferase [Sphingomonas rhizophila]|uniref:Class I SAM-dependent methyltransferase n=1 Tax=Sphingomonas rhizophila TaxID=2071607 RepID=A0A7G9SAB7_9SPHN|nr:class I SAM-dependent methyltransferase [Sphingomonas rhizophila]QNN64792.1 class I SAM-dependent methyltransferase [Sphingomonas rhizophila]
MERAVYDRMAELDASHWWFTARRRILAEVVRRIVKPPKGARILEIGAGTGHNLDMLAEFGTVEGVEFDEHAREIANARTSHKVEFAALPELETIKSGQYDLIALLDVLEHVVDDRASLAAIFDRLKPGGALLLAVPANPWMWSAHDVAHHHHRRYRKAEIAALAKDAGFDIDLLSPFNSLLYPLIAAVRVASKVTGKESSDDAMPPAPLNKALDGIFGFEKNLIGRLPLPFGVSLVAVLRRPGPTA